ncbi:integrase core domain-containing protein [Bacteroides heparinolyticus]|uniref:integrase core domain-containing protein n=1 Tax=Prevotella heparinolytica TaxID=28113 RepID=UPI0035A1517B
MSQRRIQYQAYPRETLASTDTGKDRTLSQVDEECGKINHYFCPSEQEKAIDGWVKYYNEKRFHESLDNPTPRDVYLGHGKKIKKIREMRKQKSIINRIYENKMSNYQNK